MVDISNAQIAELSGSWITEGAGPITLFSADAIYSTGSTTTVCLED